MTVILANPTNEVQSQLVWIVGNLLYFTTNFKNPSSN